MSQRAEAVLNASGVRGPALASLEGGSGLFALTGEHLIFHDGHGTRRVTLRDLSRIHSDAEGTLRVETPAGVAMSASLIGFDGDAVQQFFGQVRDVTANIKALTPPPLTPPSPTSAPSAPAQAPVDTPAPRRSEDVAPSRAEEPGASSPAPRPAPTPRAESARAPAPDPSPDPEQGVSVTAVRRPESETQRFSSPAPRITVNRSGQREQLAADARSPRENGLGLSGAVGSGLGRNLPPPGSVEIRAVRHPTSGQSAPAPASPAPSGPVVGEQHIVAAPQPPVVQADVSEYEAVPHAPEAHTVVGAAPVSPAPAHVQPTEPLNYTSRDLGTQAGRVRGVPGRLRLLAAVLVVGAIVTALLMFGNAQRLLALWVLIAGVVGAIALLSVAELAQLQTIQAAVLAGPEAAEDEPVPAEPDEQATFNSTEADENTPERHG
ncbi:hypothetical protein [Deinococcus sp. PESE-13]